MTTSGCLPIRHRLHEREQRLACAVDGQHHVVGIEERLPAGQTDASATCRRMPGTPARPIARRIAAKACETVRQRVQNELGRSMTRLADVERNRRKVARRLGAGQQRAQPLERIRHAESSRIRWIHARRSSDSRQSLRETLTRLGAERLAGLVIDDIEHVFGALADRHDLRRVDVDAARSEDLCDLRQRARGGRRRSAR